MPTTQRKKDTPKYTKTEERVTLPGKKRPSVVYVGSRGGQVRDGE